MKKVFIALFKKLMRVYWERKQKIVPIVELQDKHIENARIISNRKKLISLFPKNSIVCELGVDRGSFSKKIMEINNPNELHLVDIWDTNRYNDDKRQLVEKTFSTQIKSGIITIHNNYSIIAVTQFEDNYFDWIYIDTNHSYVTTAEELLLYSKKVKPGGIISGHDYVVGNWNGMVRYGVMEAVHEFCVLYNWEIIYITMELEDNPSFAIRQMI